MIGDWCRMSELIKVFIVAAIMGAGVTAVVLLAWELLEAVARWL